MPYPSQPYRVDWPLNPDQVRNIDEMFQTLFDFGTDLGVSAGTFSTNVSSLVFNDTNNVMFGMSGSTITASAFFNISAGTTSNNFSNIVFSNSNNVSFGLNGSTITANAPIKISASGSSGSFTDVTFSNSNNLTFGLSGSTITASAPLKVQASGTFTNNVTQLVFSNANNVSFGLTGSTITASVTGGGGGGTGNTISFFEYPPVGYMTGATQQLNEGTNAVHVNPVVLPMNLSADYIRFLVSMSAASTAFGATSANTSFSGTRFHTNAWVAYTQDTGANSLSLRSYASGSNGWTIQTIVTNGTAGSQYTVTFNITYPRFSGSSSYSTSYAASSSVYNISSQSLTLFTGLRFIDMAGASFAPSNYWFAFGEGTSSSNNGPVGLLNVGAGIQFSTVALRGTNISIGLPGAATNDSVQPQPGLGEWTTNSGFFSTAEFAISDVQLRVSNPRLYFQAIRFA